MEAQREGLEKRAVLVSFTASRWTGEAPDKNADRDIMEKRGNAAGTTRTKKFLVEETELKANGKAFSAAYNWFIENTTPWEDRRGGARLLPGANYDRFKAGLDERIGAAYERADRFTEIYPQLIADYRPKLNGLFNPANYPDPAVIRGQFSITVGYSPLPLSPDSLTLKFLGREEFNRLQGQIGQQWEKQENAAIGDLYRRLVEKVGHMARTLADPEAKFRDSLVNNLVELADLIPALNFKADPDLDALTVAMRDKLTGIDPETLRRDMTIRGQIAGEAGTLLAKITGAGSRFIDLS